MIGHHVDIAIDDVGICKAGGNVGEHGVIVKGVVGIQEADGVAGKEVKTLVHGVVDALVRLGEDADRVGGETLDDLQRASREAPSITSISLSGCFC